MLNSLIARFANRDGWGWQGVTAQGARLTRDYSKAPLTLRINQISKAVFTSRPLAGCQDVLAQTR